LAFQLSPRRMSSAEEPAWLVRCNWSMHRAVRVGALLVALTLVVTFFAFRWLGLSLPWSKPAATLSQVQPTPTPVDLYDVMGTLTLDGRTIPSARLLPAEFSLLDWIDKGGIFVNEIRPAEGWPSDRSSLPKIVRGVAVVHALLVPPSTVIYDVVPLAGALNASVCATGGGAQLVSYHLKLAGRTATIDYANALYFATYGGALIITGNGDTWGRLLYIGASPVQARPCPR